MTVSEPGNLHQDKCADLFGPVAAAQCGLITLAQARGVGMTDDQCRTLIESRQWIWVSHGIYRVAGSSDKWPHNLWVACLETGGYASHRTAGYLWRLDGLPSRPPTDLEIINTHDKRRLSDFAKVRLSRSLRPQHIYKGEGIPRTNLPRTLMDLADVMEAKPFEEAFDSALRNVSDLRPWLRRLLADIPRSRQHPGRAMLEDLLDDTKRAVDSALEVKIRQLLRDNGLPSPLTGYETEDDEGYLVKLDFAWPFHRPRVALMAHGKRFHFKTFKWNTDLDQSSGLNVLRWIVVQCSYEQVVEQPELLVRRLRRALAPT